MTSSPRSSTEGEGRSGRDVDVLLDGIRDTCEAIAEFGERLLDRYEAALRYGGLLPMPSDPPIFPRFHLFGAPQRKAQQ